MLQMTTAHTDCFKAWLTPSSLAAIWEPSMCVVKLTPEHWQQQQEQQQMWRRTLPLSKW